MISAKMERIMCMQHCSTDQNIFFLNFPSNCPICNVELNNCHLLIPPFCLPCPLSSGHDPLLRCSVIIKPTRGDFLRDYVNGENLHIGITNSRGFVYNYDERGLVIDHTWDQCARLDMTCFDVRHWDCVLETSSQSDCWTLARYNEDSNNCYDYVFKMLSKIYTLQNNQYSEKYSDKEEFCRQHILPLTTKIAKYIDLFRNIEAKGTIVRQVAHG